MGARGGRRERKARLPLLNEQGLTLIETLVSASLLTFCSLGIIAFSVHVSALTRTLRGSAAKTYLASYLSLTAKQHPALRNSADFLPANQMFRNCLYGVAGQTCSPNAAGEPVVLISPMRTVAAPAAGTLPGAEIAGPGGGTPAYYSSAGTPCASGADDDCRLAVTALFQARCALGGPPPCPAGSAAEVIEIRFEIQDTSPPGEFVLGPKRLIRTSVYVETPVQPWS